MPSEDTKILEFNQKLKKNNLKDGDVLPKEVLKNQIKFKSDLNETKKGNPKFKSEEKISAIQNINDFFDLQEKIIKLFSDYSFLLSVA